MEEKKTKADPVQSQMRKLARGYTHRDGGDLPGLAASLRDLGAFNAREVKLLIEAVKADVLQDLESPPAEAIRGLVRERLASRMLCESDSTYEEARWAVETWAAALGSGGANAQHPQAVKPALSWEEEDEEPAPKLADLRSDAPPAAGNAARIPQAAAEPAPPRFVPQPVPPRTSDPFSLSDSDLDLATGHPWSRWAAIAVAVFLLAAMMAIALAIPSFNRSRMHAAASLQNYQQPQSAR